MSIECLSAGARAWACELLSDCVSSCMSVGLWMNVWVYVWRQSLSDAYFIPSPNWFRLSAIKSSRPLCLILSAPWTVLRWNSFNQQHFVFPSAATFISRSWLLVVLFLPSHQPLFPSCSFSSHLFLTSLPSVLPSFLSFPSVCFSFFTYGLLRVQPKHFYFPRLLDCKCHVYPGSWTANSTLTLLWVRPSRLWPARNHTWTATHFTTHLLWSNKQS